jgi:hypothetical protein
LLTRILAVASRCWSRIEQLLHTLAIEDQNREDPKHGSKGHKDTFHTGHHKAERVVLPMGNTFSGTQDQNGKSPTHQNECRSEGHKEPADECGRLLTAMTELFRSQDKEQPNDQVNDGMQANNAAIKNGVIGSNRNVAAWRCGKMRQNWCRTGVQAAPNTGLEPNDA